MYSCSSPVTSLSLTFGNHVKYLKQGRYILHISVIEFLTHNVETAGFQFLGDAPKKLVFKKVTLISRI